MSKIEIVSNTDQNAKMHNEDSHIHIQQNERAILCVADGVGGLNAGEIASRYITTTIKSWATTGDVNKMGEEKTHREFSALVARMHDNLLSVAEERGVQRMGSTFVLAVVGLHKVVIENIGDSRAYVFQRNHLKQVTIDQSALVYDLVTGQNYAHGDGMFGAIETLEEERKEHILLQCIGDGERTPIPSKYSMNIDERVDILLCSDGLSNRITEYEIRDELLKNQSSEKVIQNLINLAKRRGETDNITAILYRRRP